MNTTEIPFEENREHLLKQYQEFLLNCSEIIQFEKDCLDVIIHNNYIYGIFDMGCDERIGRILAVARKIEGLKQGICCSGGAYTEKLLFGIGIASGGAIGIPVTKSGCSPQHMVWLGQVFCSAHVMAQMAVCDGRQQIRMTAAVRKALHEENCI